jgi:hypothetical protein
MPLPAPRPQAEGGDFFGLTLYINSFNILKDISIRKETPMPSYATQDRLTETVCVKVDKTQRQWLQREAAKEGRSMNNIVRRLIEEAIQRQEQQEG